MKRFFIIVSIFLIAADLYSEPLKTKQQIIANQLAEIKALGGDHLGYADEILKHLESLKIYPTNRKPERKKFYRRRRRQSSERIDAYSLLSGGLAIRESLQLDSINKSEDHSQDVEITSLKGPKINSHPFEKMLEGKKYKISTLAAYCPENFYYFHFNNMAASLDFFDYLGDVGGSLYKRYTPRAVDFKLKNKILTQLALKENKAARKFYNTVIDEMIIVGSDPFLIEGTDVTFIYKLKIPLLFKATIYNYRNGFKREFNAKQEKITISGIEGEYLYTANRKINSYLLTLKDGTIIISNSRNAAEEVLASLNKKIPSLADAADFKYMRSIYPLDKEKESGFLYLSDAFVRYLVGPELRIKEARRLNETMRIAKLEKYLIYYYQVYNRHPQNIDDLYRLLKKPPLANELKNRIIKLKENKYYTILQENKKNIYDWYSLARKAPGFYALKRKERDEVLNESRNFEKEFKDICKEIDGKIPYRPGKALEIIAAVSDPADLKIFTGLKIGENKFSAISKIYGRNGFLQPNLEKELKYVSKEEAKRYKRFVREYSNYWKDFFDPIGIRIKMKGGIKIETCILPLINSFIYNVISRIIGGEPVVLKSDNNLKGEIFSLSYKVNRKLISSQIKMLFQMMPDLKGEHLVEGLFGDQVHLHMMDRLPLFDVDSSQLVSQAMRKSRWRSRDMLIGYLFYALSHPIRHSYAVNDKDKAEQLLLILNRYIGKNGNRLSASFAKFDSYYYKYKTKLVYVLKMDFNNILKFRIYFSVLNNSIEITSTKNYMDKLIDNKDYLAQANAKNNLNNIRMVYRPSQMKEEKDLFKFNVYEAARKASFKNIATIKLLNNLFPDAKDLQKKCLELYNFEPVCPMGGKYSVNQKTGKVSNSVFGSPDSPYMQIDKMNSDMIKRYFETNQIKVELKFTREGIMTRIVTE